MKNRFIILLSGSLIIIIGVFLSLYYQADLYPGNDLINVEDDMEIPDDQFKDVELVFYNSNASIAWYLRSDMINNYGQKNLLDLSAVQITAVNSEERQANITENYTPDQILYQLTAGDTLYTVDSGVIDLSGPIIINKGDIIFKAASLSWQDGEDRIWIRGGVRVEAPYFHIKGETMEADIGLDSVMISGKEEQVFFSWKGSDLD